MILEVINAIVDGVVTNINKYFLFAIKLFFYSLYPTARDWLLVIWGEMGFNSFLETINISLKIRNNLFKNRRSKNRSDRDKNAEKE